MFRIVYSVLSMYFDCRLIVNNPVFFKKIFIPNFAYSKFVATRAGEKAEIFKNFFAVFYQEVESKLLFCNWGF